MSRGNEPQSSGRNIRIERDAQHNVIVTGDGNRIVVLRGVTSVPRTLQTRSDQGKLRLQDISTAIERPDVFLSHSHDDAEWVEELARRLEDEHAISVWLDTWKLIPGKSWQNELTLGLLSAKSCTVCIGGTAPTGWFKEELEVALNHQASHPEFRVIPVILPQGSDQLMPMFLKLRTWVDFREGKDHEYALHILVQGIKGEPVGRWPTKGSDRDDDCADDIVKMIIELRRFEGLGVSRENIVNYERKVLDVWFESAIGKRLNQMQGRS